jgi:hypothetical protein
MNSSPGMIQMQGSDPNFQSLLTEVSLLRYAVTEMKENLEKPHIIMKPQIKIQEGLYVVYYGVLQGIGESVKSAMDDFDKNWSRNL